MSSVIAKIVYDYWTQPDSFKLVDGTILEKPAFGDFVGWGFVGNNEGEYGLKWPPGRGDGKKAAGVAQWHKDRRDRIRLKTGINVETATCHDQQRAMWWEITNHSHFGWLLPRCLDALCAAKDEQDVVNALVDKFEYSGDRVRDKKRRGDDARKWRDYFKSRAVT